MAKATKSGRRGAAKPKLAVTIPPAVRWTEAKRDAFLIALAETANVVAAATAVGEAPRSPYSLRRRDPAFRAAWDMAIEDGYQRLELMLLRRATFGEGIDGDEAPAISTSFALGLLKNHQTRARRGDPDLPMHFRGGVLRDRIEAKLAEINRRLASDG